MIFNISQHRSLNNSARAISLIILALILIFSPLRATAQEKTSNVLVLHSYGEGFSWTSDINRGLLSAFKERKINADYYFEYMHSKRFPLTGSYDKFGYILKNKYEKLSFDIIVATDDAAFRFLSRQAQDLFPEATIIFCGINDPASLKHKDNISAAGFIEEIDINGTLKAALSLHPEAGRVILINDHTGTGQIFKQQTSRQLSAFGDYLEFVELYDMTGEELEASLQELDGISSVILFFAFYKDRMGNIYSTDEALKIIRRSTSWPVYSFWDFTLQDSPYSALGGSILSGEKLGYSTGLAAAEVIRGKKYPEGISIMKAPDPETVFSYPEMKRFDIDEKELPSGSRIMYQPEDLFSKFSGLIFFNIGFFVVMGILLVLLFVVVLRRKRVEKDLTNEKEYWENLFQNSPEAIVFTDEKAMLKKVNPRFCELFGFDEANILGKSLDGLFARNRSQFEEAVSLTRRIETSPGIEIETVRSDRNNRDIQVSLMGVPLVINEKHKANFWIYRDISNLKKAESEMVHRLDFEELLSRVSSRMVFIQNMDRTVLEIIEELRRFLGCSAVFVARIDRPSGSLKVMHETTGRDIVSLQKSFGDLSLSSWTAVTKELRDKGQFIFREGQSLSLLDPFISEMVEKRSIRSLLIFPVKLGAVNMEGIIGFENIWLEREWNGSDLNFLRTFSDLLGEAFRRVESNHKLERTMVELKKTFQGTFSTITKILEIKDPYTAGHQMNVTRLATAIAKEMGLDRERVEGIYYASLVHDIGKINVPSEILTKPVGLTEAEFALIKNHTRFGWEILRNIDFPWPVAEIVLQHHERLDGSGYPEGIKGDEILLESKIITVADVVEAMSADRPYRPSLGIERALEEIREHKGEWFLSQAVEVCLKLFQEKGFTFALEGENEDIFQENWI